MKQLNPSPHIFSKASKAVAFICNASIFEFRKLRHLVPQFNIKEKLARLIENEEIIVTRPDKGNGIVILDRKDYVEKTMTVLSDDTKFKIKDGNVYSIVTS